MQEIDSKFELFKSIVHGLEKTLFPTGSITNEASDVDVAYKLLNNPDIGLFLTAEFIDELKKKLNLKAQGVIKQADLDQDILRRFAVEEDQ